MSQFALGSATVMFEKHLGGGVSIWKGPMNLEGDGSHMVQMLANRQTMKYVCTIQKPADKWKTCHSFNLPAFKDRTSQIVNVRGLGKVRASKGMTRDDEHCIRLQVLSLQQNLPM